MAITRTQIARQLYRYGGDTMGGPNDKSNQGPTGGGETNRERGIRESYQEAARRGALKNLATRQAEDKAEEAVEVFRNRNRGGAFNKVLNAIPGIGTARRIASVFGPINNRDFFLDRVAPKNFGAMSISKQQEMFDQYMGARGRNEIDAYGNPIESDNGDGQQFIFPQMMMAQAPSITKQEPEEKLSPKSFRFFNKGGIADTVVGGEYDFESARQMYGFGKLVKKATKAVKKVAKSPIGKAAIAAATIKFGGPLAAKFAPGTFGSAAKNPFLRAIGRGQFFGDTGIFSAGKNLLFGTDAGIRSTPGLFDKFPGGGIGAAITAASMLPLLGIGTGDESEEEAQAIIDKSGLDIDAIRANPNQFLARRFRAEGGRIGYDNGGYTFDQFKKDKFKIDQFMGEEQMRKYTKK